MTAAKRRKIKQLRALAASTTFPEEAKSATAKADKLEAALPKVEPSEHVFDASAYLGGFGDVLAGMPPVIREQMERQVRAAMGRAFDDGLWDMMMGRP